MNGMWCYVNMLFISAGCDVTVCICDCRRDAPWRKKKKTSPDRRCLVSSVATLYVVRHPHLPEYNWNYIVLSGYTALQGAILIVSISKIFLYGKLNYKLRCLDQKFSIFRVTLKYIKISTFIISFHIKKLFVACIKNFIENYYSKL